MKITRVSPLVLAFFGSFFGLLFALPCRAQYEEPIPEKNPYSSKEDIAQGEKLFLGWCASCHGPRGEGGTGANLAQPRLPRATDDRTLFRIIRTGIPGTEMPRTNLITDREVWQMAAFVRHLGALPRPPVPGDAARGERLYRTKGNCAQCHSVGGVGGGLGPALGEIGARRSPAYLRQALLEPEAAFPERFQQVRVVTRDGKRVSGVRVNESAFSIQVRGSNDAFHSFRKSELAEVHRDRGKSPMPSYRDILTASEVDDIVAYMVSLRGGQ